MRCERKDLRAIILGLGGSKNYTHFTSVEYTPITTQLSLGIRYAFPNMKSNVSGICLVPLSSLFSCRFLSLLCLGGSRHRGSDHYYLYQGWLSFYYSVFENLQHHAQRRALPAITSDLSPLGCMFFPRKN